MKPIRYKGKIKSREDDKGFGFITSFETGQDIFMHISGFENRARRPTVGDIVTYQLTQVRNNRTQASNVLFSGELPPQPNTSISSRSIFLCFISSLITRLISIAAFLEMLAYGYQQFSQHETLALPY